jgi:GUN4-like
MKLFLTLLLASIAVPFSLPASAQASPKPIVCQATIPVEQGASLTYRLTGVFPDPIAANMPQNPIGWTVTMTVQRRDRNGRIQTLLNQAIARDYEQVGPDADYSKLPFTGEFRGKPNDGFRLYAVQASTHGLYASLRPTRGQPQKIQILHYLSKGQLSRSIAGTCTPKADHSAILTPLQIALNAKQWAKADQETRRILSPSSVSLQPMPEIKLTSELLQDIDQLWMNASNGRFGLAVQAQIWREVQRKHPKNQMAAVDAFRDRVGWKIPRPRPDNDFISSDWRNQSELTYSEKAPIGHFPWAGVNDAIVQSIAVPPPDTHCGVCTVDAMQLRNERFYGEIPKQMQKFQAAL